MENVFKFSTNLKNEKDIMSLVNGVFELGTRLELCKVDLCKTATAISELATNLVKYAENGKVAVCATLEQDYALVEVESIDDGPGIPDIAKAMSEHYSSGTSLGVGLPAIKRLSDSFEIESSTRGTVIKITKRIGRSND
ncbi:MAG: anti-sigma regulatory factor [Bacteriovoracaceae bacterium]|nr:anti-sigma regulatory factor [Bacteriovoracaceae bacterium]